MGWRSSLARGRVGHAFAGEPPALLVGGQGVVLLELAKARLGSAERMWRHGRPLTAHTFAVVDEVEGNSLQAVVREIIYAGAVSTFLLDAADGSPLSTGRAIGRYVLAWLWFLPPLALLILAVIRNEAEPVGPINALQLGCLIILAGVGCYFVSERFRTGST